MRIKAVYPRQTGFTLVEIAIVLVIIGLLLGGILKGQEMITQARIKNMVNDFNGVTSAYFSYQDRYKAVAGDDVNADTRWTSFGAKKGSGNGIVGGAYDQSPPSDPSTINITSASEGQEAVNFWWHMRLAGFIPGPTSGPGAATQPTNAVGGLTGVQTGGLGLTSLVVCSANIPDKIASAVDTQLDDQKPGTGSMRAMLQSGSISVTPTSTTPSNFEETGANQYVLCKSI
ncbi:MAG: prepilin-type N-terminal cleavage/methylation domain-containing protein [Burkholderiales bacterium]|nr:prepilin-type N-terminal cleavage/methylation domain-containing protein [Burkholderiales bacterium]